MSKYHNKIVYHDGYKFDSKKEGEYYLYLRELQKKGKISNLRMQVPFLLLPAVYEDVQAVKQLKKGPKMYMKKCCIQRKVEYFADFVYTDNVTGLEEVVDVKSKATEKKEAYRLKKKMMLALLGIKIVEVIY